MRKFLTLAIVLIMTSAIGVVAQSRRANYGHQKMEIPASTMIFNACEVDDQPQFPGGERALANFINEIKTYPKEAYKQGVQGRVVLSFVVHPDGSINGIEILKGVEVSLNKEAIRIIRKMPHWIPGRIDATRVATRCVVAIPFRL